MFNIDLKNVKIKDDFFSAFQNKVIDMVIPYQEAILRDQVEGAEKSHAIENFRIAAGLSEGEFYGMVFQDSDVAKWIEGASYSLIIRKDEELEKRIDEIIDIIGKAQRDNGYLDTYFTVKAPDDKWTDLLEGHELYCAGHMIEAGVAYYEATGKDSLLKICEKLADHIDDTFRIGGKPGYPGHQEIELACMKLYKATGKERYMLLAKHFLEARGVNVDFFKEEKAKRKIDVFGMDPDNHDYNQSFAPVKMQKKAVGHSVRAMYMYEAMADLAAENGDEELLEACKTLWTDVVTKKMFVTGGIGSDGSLESFSESYYLPNDMAYNETCAQIGMMFFTKKLLDAQEKPEGKYADIIELLIYNSTISGMQYDGTRFFYVNPLEVNPGISGQIFGHKHVVPRRPRWYACACCPPNLVRMITSLGKYTVSEDDDTVYSHTFIGQEVNFKKAFMRVESSYPWKGQVTYYIRKKPDADRLTAAIHLPGYVKEYSIIRDGQDVTSEVKSDKGYLYFDGFGDDESCIEIRFELKVRRLYANDRVYDDAGCVAFKRGPIVYCIESCDNGENLHILNAVKGGCVKETDWSVLSKIQIDERSNVTLDPLKDVVCLEIEGCKRTNKEDELYTDEEPQNEKCTLTAIPYYLWSNREAGQMKVWIREGNL